MTLLGRSLAGGLLILLVALVRLIGRRRLPGRTFVVLWMVVALRLLLPVPPLWWVTLPTQVPVSAAQIEIAADGITDAGPLEATPVSVGDSVPLNAVPMPETAPEEGLATAEPVAEPWTTDRLAAIGRVLWTIGTAGFALWFGTVYLRGLLHFRRAQPVEAWEAKEWLGAHPLLRPLALKILGGIDSPLTYGVLRPVILLPEGTDWTSESLRYALEHEFVHVRRCDVLIKLLFAAALCVHWWNPLVWLFWFIANRDVELSCDEAVLARLGEASRGDYARALLSMEERRSLPRLYAGFGSNTTRERIRSVLQFKRATVWTILLAVVLVVAIAVCAALGARRSASEPTAEATVIASLYGDPDHIPLWMQPNSVIEYDAEGNWTVVEGGMLTAAEIQTREDVLGMLESDVPAEPNTRVSYDLHGFLADIWYPDGQGGWQLAPPEARATLPTVLPENLHWGVSLLEAAKLLGAGDLETLTDGAREIAAHVTELNELLGERGFSLTGGFNYYVLYQNREDGQAAYYFTPDGGSLYEASVSDSFREDDAAAAQYDTLLGALSRQAQVSYAFRGEPPYRPASSNEVRACGFALDRAVGTYTAVALTKRDRPTVSVWCGARGALFGEGFADAAGLYTAPDFGWSLRPEELDVEVRPSAQEDISTARVEGLSLFGLPASAELTFFQNALSEVTYTLDAVADREMILSRLIERCGRYDLDHDYADLDVYCWRAGYLGTLISSQITYAPVPAGSPTVTFTLRSAAPFLEN